MTRQRITPVAVLLAAVLAMGAGIARGQETVRIATSSTVQIAPDSRHIVVTGVTAPPKTFTSTCMNAAGFDDEEQGGKVVVVNGRFTFLVSPVYYSEPISPGTRLVNPTLVSVCTDNGDTYNIYQCEIANPQNLEISLVTTPAGVTLAADHEAVVGAGTDELGIADAVCVKKGEKSVKTGIISDIPLEPGDRLTDFFQLDFDLDTGETLYGAWLEY